MLIDLIDPDRPKNASGSITSFASSFKRMGALEGGVIDLIDPYSPNFLRKKTRAEDAAACDALGRSVEILGRSGRSPPQKLRKTQEFCAVDLIDPEAVWVDQWVDQVDQLRGAR